MRVRKFGIAIILSCSAVMTPAKSQVANQSAELVAPEGLDWVDGLTEFCRSVAGDRAISPLYQKGFLDGASVECDGSCIDKLISGDFQFIEMEINEKMGEPKTTSYSFSPGAGRFRLERVSAGHDDCVLFDQMQEKFLASGLLPSEEYRGLLDKYCIAVVRVDSFISKYGIRQSFSPPFRGGDGIGVMRVGEEIYNLKTNRVYSARYQVSLKSTPKYGGIKIQCGAPRGWSSLSVFIKPHKD